MKIRIPRMYQKCGGFLGVATHLWYVAKQNLLNVADFCELPFGNCGEFAALYSMRILKFIENAHTRNFGGQFKILCWIFGMSLSMIGIIHIWQADHAIYCTLLCPSTLSSYSIQFLHLSAPLCFCLFSWFPYTFWIYLIPAPQPMMSSKELMGFSVCLGVLLFWEGAAKVILLN